MHAPQLGLFVGYDNPLQFMCWYDKPSFYEDEKEIAFFDAVKIGLGRHPGAEWRNWTVITVARRSGDEWFVGAIPIPNHGKLRFRFRSWRTVKAPLLPFTMTITKLTSERK